MTINTIFIYQEIPENLHFLVVQGDYKHLCFLVVQGDYKHLEGVYVNGGVPDNVEWEGKCNQLLNILNGCNLSDLPQGVQKFDRFPYEHYRGADLTRVVVCGFIH